MDGCGVMFHFQYHSIILKEQDWPISVEYQMLAEVMEGEPRPTGNMCSPGTEVFYDGEMDPRHCINSSSDTYKWNEWVQTDLIAYSGSLVIHKVNGEKVLEHTKPQGREPIEILQESDSFGLWLFLIFNRYQKFYTSPLFILF